MNETIVRKNVSPRTIMAIQHTDRCYLFDLFDNGRIIASRAPFSQSPQGESICEYLSPVTFDEVRAHLLSYSSLPMVVDSTLGTGMVFPVLTPASSLGIFCVSNLPRDLFIRLAKTEESEEFVFASTTSDIRARASKRTAAYREGFEEWITAVRGAFEGEDLKIALPPNATLNDILGEHALRLSRYLGCPITWSERGCVMNYGDFDYPLFVAFAAALLCLARRISADRSAQITLGTTGFGGTVSVRMLKREGSLAEQMQELLSLRALAERKNILFDYAEDDAFLAVRFSPVNKDWSYLELKASDPFAWIDEKNKKAD